MTSDHSLALDESLDASLEPRRRDVAIYWTTTATVAAVMLWSGINFAVIQKGAFAHFGLPDWFRLELTTAKIIGAWVLLVPAAPFKLKEFAYCGFAIVLISAPIAHLASGDSVWLVIGHLTFLVLLAISYLTFRRVRIGKRLSIS